jgi:hypothetical protein
MGFELRGVAEMDANMRRIAAAVEGAKGGALYRRAEAISTASDPLVPVDYGILKNSRFVDKPQQDGNTVSVRLGYGGAAAPYAAIVHEDMEAHHDVGQAKYLEEPFLEATATLKRDLAEDLGDAAKGAV